MKTCRIQPGVFSMPESMFCFMLFTLPLKTICFLESCCPEGLSCGCVPWSLSKHPGTTALALQTMCCCCCLELQQDIHAGSAGGSGRAAFGAHLWGEPASARLLHPQRREAQGAETAYATSGCQHVLVDGQHVSPLLCQELCFNPK